ncbi:MAG: signal peptide peptidase SppA [Bdellovibrionota bacterium]|mgnify:CR=1 FL=1
MRKTIGTIFIIITIGMVASCVIMTSRFADEITGGGSGPLIKKSILSLEIDGIIMDSDDFVEALRKYAKEDEIKGVLIRVNSPGGVVGPSQEMYAEIKRVRDVLKKPVVVSMGGLAASGAYYASVGATKILTNPGTMVGSIGVIMEFANLEKLYDWAKIKRYTIKTGAYKDSGAEYREMRDDERLLFQQMADEVLGQFKAAIAEGRKMDPAKVTQYADGRVFTGETAVKLGFADEIGTFQDAIRTVGQLSGIGEEPELFEPPKKRPSLSEIFAEIATNLKGFGVEGTINQMLRPELLGRPLFLMPGSYQGSH